MGTGTECRAYDMSVPVPMCVLSIVHGADDFVGKTFRKNAVKNTFCTGDKVDGIKRFDFGFQCDFRNKIPCNLRVKSALFILFHLCDGTDDPAPVFLISCFNFFPDRGEIGLDVAGLDGTDTDAVGFYLIDECAGVAVDSRFGRGIVSLERNGENSGHGAGVDDPAAALFPHDGECRFVDIHHTEKIHVHLPFGLFQRCEFNGAGNAEAGTVDDNIQMAFCIPYFPDRGFSCIGIGHINRNMNKTRVTGSSPAERINLTAFLLQRDGGTESDSGCPAGDDRDFFSHC